MFLEHCTNAVASPFDVTGALNKTKAAILHKQVMVPKGFPFYSDLF